VTSPVADTEAIALFAELQVKAAPPTGLPRLSVRDADRSTDVPALSEAKPLADRMVTTGGISGDAGSPQEAAKARAARKPHATRRPGESCMDAGQGLRADRRTARTVRTTAL
jgi:hypothetical protein